MAATRKLQGENGLSYEGYKKNNISIETIVPIGVCAKANCEWLYLFDRPHWAIEPEPVNAKAYKRCVSSNFIKQTDSLAHRSPLNIQNLQQKKFIHYFYVCVCRVVCEDHRVSRTHTLLKQRSPVCVDRPSHTILFFFFYIEVFTVIFFNSYLLKRFFALIESFIKRISCTHDRTDGPSIIIITSTTFALSWWCVKWCIL